MASFESGEKKFTLEDESKNQDAQKDKLNKIVDDKLADFPKINNPKTKEFFDKVFQKMDNKDIKLAQFDAQALGKILTTLNKNEKAYDKLMNPNFLKDAK